MCIVEFPYSFHLGRKVPIIPVYIKVASDFQKVWAYVDSGATYSIFEEKEGSKLQIDIPSGKKIMVMVGDGGFIPVYLHKLPFKIGEFEIEATVGFSGHLGIGFNLLGRRDIFENFQVCFNDKEEVVTFQKLAAPF